MLYVGDLAQHLELDLAVLVECEEERHGKHLGLLQEDGEVRLLVFDKTCFKLRPPSSCITTLYLVSRPSFSSLWVIHFFNLLWGVVGTVMLAL